MSQEASSPKPDQPESLPSVESQWEAFSSRVFKNVNVLPIQKIEMKRAFFAGSLSMLIDVNKLMASDRIDEECQSAMNNLNDECCKFFSDIVSAYAKRN